jgi:hypothetical protein
VNNKTKEIIAAFVRFLLYNFSEILKGFFLPSFSFNISSGVCGK